ncbi:MAG: acetyl-CoA synthetase [Myxococcales bacterium SG8_38_1]|nr:MAG: acetyl-CoA synthetase [Myxococcales bacterium SG8_38_1]
MTLSQPTLENRKRISSMEDYQALYDRSLTNTLDYWRTESQELHWFYEPHSIFEEHGPGEFVWFGGGRLNVAVNCVDRHAAKNPDKTAIIFVADEPGEYQHISFAELKTQVGRTANTLRALGVRKGDRVCIYLPMIPELAYTMLACARIGAVHSIVFGGFSADALRDRIIDAEAKIVVTANEGLRGSKRIPLKKITDDAVEGLGVVEKVLVVQRTDAETSMEQGRDIWMHEATADQRITCPSEWMASEDPLFILYTSGSTGKPKGLVHTTAGYLTYAASTFKYVFDISPDDIHFCAADIGWITGHSYIIYGPLANGVTTVMFESVPTYPDASRYWNVIDDIGATTLYTSPTALRALMREGSEPVKGSSRESLRVLGTVGEPINPEVWKWYHEVVGNGKIPIVDTWWQTETGGILISPLPNATKTKPGSATFPLFGIQPILVDQDGKVIKGNDVSGYLCIERPWPGQARTIHGNHKRFLETYFSQYPPYYFTGDGCKRDADGYYWITGRVDDVINVSGHRLGTAEVESALVAHQAVAEAAVVPCPHEIKGQGIFAFVVPIAGGDYEPGELQGALKEQVRQVIGPIATPDEIRVVSGLPKTRSGKIMRRILRKIAANEADQLGDISTLADPSVVEALLKKD